MTRSRRFLPLMFLAAFLPGMNDVSGQPGEKAPPPPAAPAPLAKDKGPLVIKENSCLKCHSNAKFLSFVVEEKWQRYHITDKDLAKDIHWQRGLRCFDCHGGDPTSDNKLYAHAGRRLIESPKDIPGFCGHCHSDIEFMRKYQPSPRTDQVAEYWTSGHGKQLKKTGDTQVAVCTSCHGGKHNLSKVHDLESPVYVTNVAKTCAKCHSDPKIMEGRQYHGRPLGTHQYDEWKESVHGKKLEKGDLSAPTCVRCHGNHGAAPPQIDSVANACGSCHGKVAKLFENTRMKHGFEKEGLPGCATCHMKDAHLKGTHLILHPTDKMLGMGEDTFCVKCHTEGKAGKFGATLAGAEVARKLRDGLNQLDDSIKEADAKVKEAEFLGMEVSQPRFDLHKASNAQVNARTLIHTFSPVEVQKALDEGTKIASEVKEKAEAALQAYTGRRIWLAVSLVPIALVVVLLLLFIRRLPVPDKETRRQGDKERG